MKYITKNLHQFHSYDPLFNLRRLMLGTLLRFDETHFPKLVKKSTFESKWIWHLSWFRVLFSLFTQPVISTLKHIVIHLPFKLALKLAFFDIFGLFTKFVNYVDVIIRIILSFTFSPWEHCMLWFDECFLQNFVKNCGRIKKFVKLR